MKRLAEVCWEEEESGTWRCIIKFFQSQIKREKTAQVLQELSSKDERIKQKLIKENLISQ